MSNMVIATNVMALNSHRALKGVGNEQARSSERLSSGYRINRAADDAAGLAISEKMRSQIRGLDQASRNSLDGISLIQTAEGALQESENMLQRMRELTVQASNDTLTASDRNKIALELNELIDEIDATAAKTEFNTKKLIDGSWKKAEIYLQTGANKEQGLSFNISQMDSAALGVTKGSITSVINGGVDVKSLGTMNVSTAAGIKDFAGTYKLDNGGSFTINSDGSVRVVGLKDSDGVYLDPLKSYTLTELSTMGTTTPGQLEADKGATVDFSTLTGVTFGAVNGALAVLPADTTQTAGDIVSTTFGQVSLGTTQLLTSAFDASDTFRFDNGVRLLDSNGKEIAFEVGKGYTGTELNTLGVDSIVDKEGNKYTLTAGKLTAQSTKVITFAAGSNEAAKKIEGKAAVGEGDGKTISKLTEVIDAAIEIVSSQRAQLGAYQNRLEHTIKNLDTSSENLSASESRIRDTDMAKEMMNLTKNNVLQQAATAMLAQANQAPQNILKLLG